MMAAWSDAMKAQSKRIERNNAFITSQRSPQEIIADFIWSEIDVQDLDDMGSDCAQRILDRLTEVGWKVVPSEPGR